MENPFEKIFSKLDAIERQINPQKVVDTDEWLEIDEACRVLRSSKSWIYKKTMQNQLPFYKLGGKKLLFKRSELNHFINQHLVREINLPGIKIEK